MAEENKENIKGKGKRRRFENKVEPKVEPKVEITEEVKVEKPEVVVKVKAKKPKEKVYSYIAYCNVIGAENGIRFVANLKFKAFGKKTESEWKEIFKEHRLID